MPPSSARAPNASYKTNVNRTKTRKWVEAKVQNYDGDDWGNDYDDYDDGDDQHHEPEPPPPPPTTRLTGLRQPGPSGHRLPSSRTFSQPATASLPSNAEPRAFGPSTLRSATGPLSLHVQTQPTAPATTPSPYTIGSAHPAPVPSSHATGPLGHHSAGPASTPSRFPPRKSSMGQMDRPDVGQIVTRPDSPPNSGSNNGSVLDQRPVSPNRVPAPTVKTLPFVRPSDIYKRMEEEKEKERSSMDSGRPSLDSPPGRPEGTPSSGQLRLSEEQRRRPSVDKQEGSESARPRKSSLAPVAERKSEYGMEGLFAKPQADRLPISYQPAASNPELSMLQMEPSDEVKTDLMSNRRFSTSPQLPSLTRVSGFGDDFWSSSGSYTTQPSPKVATASEASRPQPKEIDRMAVTTDGTTKQPPRFMEAAIVKSNVTPTTEEKPKVTKERNPDTTQRLPSFTRPQLPGGWVSESPSVPAPSHPSTPLEQQEAQDLPGLANTPSTSMSPVRDIEPNLHPKQIASLRPSMDIPGIADQHNQPNDIESNSTARQPSGGIASEALGNGVDRPTPQSLPPLMMENSRAAPSSRPTSTIVPTVKDNLPQAEASSMAQPTTTATTVDEISPTAPLNTNRPEAGQPHYMIPSTDLRKSTISTVETMSPEKESDKLREEIIKSLSPPPLSPGYKDMPTLGGPPEPLPGDLSRESTYLAGVYDDYLSFSEEKSPLEVGQDDNKSAQMAHGQTIGAEIGSTSIPQDMPALQPAPLSSEESPPLNNTSKPRRFSWQHDPEEVALNPVQSKPSISIFPEENSAYSQSGRSTEPNAQTTTISPVAVTTGTISHQVSAVSSRGPEEASLAAIESPSPLSVVATRTLKPDSDERNIARLSLADEKEKVLIGDAQSTTSSVSGQHPALAEAAEQADDGPSPVLAIPEAAYSQPLTAPTPFREILNLGTPEERTQRFDETREQFYVTDSGLTNWLQHLQSQPEHADAVATYNGTLLASKIAAQPLPGAAQLPFRTGTASSNPRRSSIGNMQQLMAGHPGFGASGNQVGTKSKELLHAAGAFGNKGMKSGMKLFNKGKNKLRERAAGDKAFF
ncbi:hypothetical protein F4802DRAFT_600810 [Xylaria palmicola]|nr:hypothetical protein F4802DRAFT_600810 [Xylaria palmicola]